MTLRTSPRMHEVLQILNESVTAILISCQRVARSGHVVINHYNHKCVIN